MNNDDDDKKRRENGRVFLAYIEDCKSDDALAFSKSVGGAANIDARRPGETHAQTYNLWYSVYEAKYRGVATFWCIVSLVLETRGWQWDLYSSTCFLTMIFRRVPVSDHMPDWMTFSKELDRHIDWAAVHPATLSSIMNTLSSVAEPHQQREADAMIESWLLPELSFAALNYHDPLGRTPLEIALTTTNMPFNEGLLWSRTACALMQCIDRVTLHLPKEVKLNDSTSNRLAQARHKQELRHATMITGFASVMALITDTWLHDFDALVISYLMPPPLSK